MDDPMVRSDLAVATKAEAWSIPTQPRDVPRYDVVRWQSRRSTACVVIPVINEGERIRRVLGRMAEIGIPEQADVIIVDGGSKDGSLEADDLDRARVAGLLVKRDVGKLSAQLRCAYDFVLGQGYDEIVTIDGNNKDDPDPIPAFIAALRGGIDFVQASRFLPGGGEENTPWKRRLAVRLIHAPMLSLASGFHWTDTTQGFRGYSRQMLIDPRLAIFRDVFMDYELLAYMNYRAPRLGFKCTERPTARRYPPGEKVPTKIGLWEELKLAKVLLATCVGRYDPR
jgi:glycosyltransferase involved in cell wall biosynthesis